MMHYILQITVEPTIEVVTSSPTPSPITANTASQSNSASDDNNRAIVNEYIALITTLVIFVCICFIGYFLCATKRKPEPKLAALQVSLLGNAGNATDLDPVLPDGDIQLTMHHTNTHDHIEQLMRS